MGKYANFELKEFITSDTAKKKGIDNTPTFDVVENLDELVGEFLQPLRDAWKKPIKVTSGYRCPALNRAVGGVTNSAHRIGYAADLQSGDARIFFEFIKKWVRENEIPFDQLFIETKKSVRWIHVGLKNDKGEQRGTISSLIVQE